MSTRGAGPRPARARSRRAAGALLLAALVCGGLAAQAQVSLREFAPDPLRDAALAPPPSHDERWLETHGSASTGGDCASCHTERDCADCHAGAVAPLVIHPPGYVGLHAWDAGSDSATCASCHRVETFCRACHVASDWTAEPEYAPQAGVEVHPPGWSDPAAPWNHGDAARDDLLSCVSCHAPDTCVDCHRFVNPHGGGFAADCAPLLRAGRATCATCHTGSSPRPLELLDNDPRCR